MSASVDEEVHGHNGQEAIVLVVGNSTHFNSPSVLLQRGGLQQAEFASKQSTHATLKQAAHKQSCRVASSHGPGIKPPDKALNQMLRSLQSLLGRLLFCFRFHRACRVLHTILTWATASCQQGDAKALGMAGDVEPCSERQLHVAKQQVWHQHSSGT